MEISEIFGLIRQYGADVLVIGGIVFALTALLKRTLLKKLERKYITFLPFVLGIAVYLAYGAAAAGDFAENAGMFIQKGFSCGSLATVIHVLIKQFSYSGSLPDRGALRAACAEEMLSAFADVPAGYAQKIAETAETDEEEARTLIDALGEEAAHAANALLTALRHI